MSDTPGGQIPLTRAQYDALTPRAKGYAVYMQGAWNKEVPDLCPFPANTYERGEFEKGSFAAMLDVQEVES